MQPDATLVIPVFNKEKYLRPCLESVLAQSHGAIEIICIDDASTDGSLDILQEFSRTDPRLRIVYHASNLGAAAARNAGIAAATGRYVRFVDADDLLPGDSTAMLFESAVRSDADLVRGSLARFRDDDPSRLSGLHDVPETHATHLRDERALWIPWWHTSYLFSVDLLRDNGLRYPPLRRGEDPVFLANVLTHAARITLISGLVYLYRKYPKQSGSEGTDFESMADYVKHAALVKAIYHACHPPCWDEGYGPFLHEEVRLQIARSRMSAAHKEELRAELKTIWNDVERTRSRHLLSRVMNGLRGMVRP